MPKLCEGETFRTKYSFSYYCRLHCIALLYCLHVLLQCLSYLYMRRLTIIAIGSAGPTDDRGSYDVWRFDWRYFIYYIILYVKNIIIIITDTAGNNSDGGAYSPCTIYHATHGGSSEREPFFFGVLYYDNNTGTYNILYIIGVILLPSNQL